MIEEDLTLDTLLNVGAEVAHGLDVQILKQCYLIQKRFQFSSDRAVVVSEMERIIDVAVARQIDGNEG
ncbi:hypothetical protein ELG87_14825 [Rhizobium leguminosarum]|uniref:hypothetical protein n=1 Tax=Rhizobium leguminosarum TaxID=384 RepID=UPI00103003BF|nr:hypothetical protein [Rhizobium leguminosarum]TBF57613.1 hypothetical protein ELG87_14825 [Rhizobium leguminosarum]